MNFTLSTENCRCAQNGTYILFASSQLLSVPYALYAEKAGSADSTTNNSGTQIESGSLLLDKDFNIINKNSLTDTLVTITQDGRIGIGTSNPKGDVEFGVNKRLHLSSEEWHLGSSGVITIQALNNLAKPSMVWYDEFNNPHAALTTYDRSSVDAVHQKEFAIETDDGEGNMLPRLTIPYQKDKTTVGVYNSDFMVKTGNFMVGDSASAGNSYFYGDVDISARLRVGDLVNSGDFSFSNSNAVVELYKKNKPVEMLLKTESEQHASLLLTRGESKWVVENNGNLTFSYNDEPRLTFNENGNMGVKTTNPTERLDVNGNIRITGSYYMSNANHAMYFEAEEKITKGSVVGINPSNGKARNLVQGDYYVGVADNSAGVIMNYQPQYVGSSDYVLVVLLGEVSISSNQITNTNGVVSLSGSEQIIGYMTSSGKVLLK